MGQQPQRLFVGLALPDHVDVAHGHVNGLVGEHLGRDIEQHAVAHVDRVLEPHQRRA